MTTSTLEDGNCAGGEGEEELDEEGKDRDDRKTEKSALQQTQRPAWAPCYFSYTNKEVYYYVGQKIIIQEGLDSYAGQIWPAALALCHYLDTHREQLRLVDKAVLEIGAGTGLVSIVAALLGGWVTATDLPETLNNLRVNLSRNTRDGCRYTPQVAALSWGHDLEHTYPTSIYRYDYVLAADVVYHHDFLDELLVTMKHFCKPGTTLVWANKVRFETDLTFIENLKKAFNVSLLAEDGELKIFMATSRDGDIREQHLEQNYREVQIDSTELEEDQNKENDSGTILNCDRSEDEKEQNDDLKRDEEEKMEETGNIREDGHTEATDSSYENVAAQNSIEQTAAMPNWARSIRMSLNKDIYHYVGQDIIIQESIDSYGAVLWPAALALCSFLDNNKDVVNLQGKEVLELGAGTGLVTIVASLLGASVTATDLKDVLGNLSANVARNTRGRCKHMPKVAHLSWGNDLEQTYPSTTHRYDYVLAADVVYHHDFLNELLITMKYFNKPGTTLIWANKVRFETDLTFTENFKKAFSTSLLFEDGEMKIFKAVSG
ncbi:uncharacterized protein mettl21ca [Gouania willdenowi]|uniref:Uncharacterized LOC114481459 n=1 Tax=Gouania willdenowi TaxID=441366 RepID=A0A8C5EW69_GOUWI|nr:uncharacterized protein LOC114481459 [Gouania willdenowi]